MADHSKIEWTDATWTPVKGCTRVSPGCGGPGKAGGCYAEIMAARFSQPGQWGEGLAEIVTSPDGSKDHRWTGVVRFDEAELLKPLRWKKPRKIFVCSTADLFHEKVEDDWIDRVFAVMALCPQHTFQVLTKRPERMRAYMSDRTVVRRICTRADKLRIAASPDPDRFPNAFHRWLAPSARLVAWTHVGGCASDMFIRREPGRDWPSWVGWPFPNVWLGTSAEDQQRAEERIPHLLATPAALRFVSAEPLLGNIELPPHAMEILDWIIVGGESGPGARPMHPDWARSLRHQCAAAGVPFFFKQHGEWIGVPDLRNLEGGQGPGFGAFDHCPHDMDAEAVRVGKAKAGRRLDGQLHDGMPV